MPGHDRRSNAASYAAAVTSIASSRSKNAVWPRFCLPERVQALEQLLLEVRLDLHGRPVEITRLTQQRINSRHRRLDVPRAARVRLPPTLTDANNDCVRISESPAVLGRIDTELRTRQPWRVDAGFRDDSTGTTGRFDDLDACLGELPPAGARRSAGRRGGLAGRLGRASLRGCRILLSGNGARHLRGQLDRLYHQRVNPNLVRRVGDPSRHQHP